jgi:hypothetical protein
MEIWKRKKTVLELRTQKMRGAEDRVELELRK